MDSRHLRPHSPTRRFAHPARNSTGLLDLHPPSYDSYGGPRSSREYIPGPRSSADRVGAPRTSLAARADPMPLRRNPDDYEVAPRLRAGTDASRRPPNIVPVSSDRYRPSISSAVEKSPRYNLSGRPREDESFYVQPAVSSRRDHGRTFSSEGPEYGRYLAAAERDRRPDRGGYRGVVEGGGRHRDAPQIRPPRDKDDHDFGYEYTDFKEQAYRDTAPRARPRRESDAGIRERPLSITGLEDVYAKRAVKPDRDGPPVSTRGFSKIDRNGSVRHEYRYPRDAAYDDADGVSSRKLLRAPVSLHQDGYSSNAEDRGGHDRHRRRRAESIDRVGLDGAPSSRYAKAEELGRKDPEKLRRHERHRSESRDEHPRHHHSRYQVDGSRDYVVPEPARREREEEPDRDREKRRKARGEEPDKDYSRRDRGDDPERERRRRDRGDDSRRDKDDHKDNKHDRHVGEGVAALGAAGAAAAAAGAYAGGSKHRHDKKSADARDIEPGRDSPTDTTSEDERRERRRRRRRERREREEREAQEALLRGKNDPSAGAAAKEPPPGSFDGNGQPLPAAADKSVPEDANRRSSRHERKDSFRPGEGSSSSSSEEDTRPRRVRIAEPGKPVPEVKPKGILRPPREKFPEDPAPIREGVAPLKDAGKKGIPPNARWTKIDRRLVNPEALEVGNERFEERPDYVIVLRVLSKEEIEAYAQKTMEIREERRIEAHRAHMLALEEKERRYDDDREPPKRLDNRAHNDNEYDLPVRAPPPEQRGVGQQQQQQSPQPVAAGGPPMPNNQNSQDSFDSNGSSRPDYYPSTSYERFPPASMSNTTSSLNSVNTPPSSQGGMSYSPQLPQSMSNTTSSLNSVHPTPSSSSVQTSQSSQQPYQGHGHPHGQGTWSSTQDPSAPPGSGSSYAAGPSSYSQPSSDSPASYYSAPSQSQGNNNTSSQEPSYAPQPPQNSYQYQVPSQEGYSAVNNAYGGQPGAYPPAAGGYQASPPPQQQPSAQAQAQAQQAPPVGGIPRQQS